MANDDVDGFEVLDEAPYETAGRVDPTYEPAVQQYHAPVAEKRSFWSRFWWLIPLVVLLIALPFMLRSCDRVEVESLAVIALWIPTFRPAFIKL